MRALKDDEVLPNSQILTSEFIANLIRDNLNSLPFSNFFKAKPILVPTPRSSLIRPGTLWVPQRLANALAQRGLGKNVEPCLNRFKAVRKSATSQGDRPKAFEHYNSMEVQKIFPEPSEILLIDDIVTRGATLLGAANKLADAFPRAHIRVFAAMRTISPPDVFRSLFDPCVGNIELRGIDTFRRP
ncbi:purine/pyrimidine phosphoribosyl transferases signature-containing protein [Candidatus Nitrososphaera gargensis Ga9.2]|uniref:Purine/pyrimidine phosphoribosyl transferases signature-containing protein n=2 Tax=Candidatus Nitrososphaera gargensis TaxID=497727 RepID=K0II67_NITGG|nr:purine/pyrimidine phosphoribosyl transferases signature-containing protein [Candidatus Nitrososphaera gargensis Ga9.2]